MKNLLIATTALVATAGFAAADAPTLSGAANVGVFNNGTANADLLMYNNVSVTAAMSSETDGGLTFGASLTFRAGDDVDLDTGDLQTNEAAGAVADFGSETSLGNIHVSGDFGKLTFDSAGIDNLMDDAATNVQDVQYDGTFGGVSVTVQADVDNSNAAADGSWAAKAVYSGSGVTVTAVTNSGSEADVTLAYAMNDMLTASVNYDTNGQTTAETIVKVAYSNAGMTAHLALADDDDDQWELGLGYAANGMSIAAVFAENDGAAVSGMESDITASYDLGGGMSINAATNESGAFYIGSKMSF